MCGLRPREELEGRSLVPLLKDPAADWEGVVGSTVGRGSHSVCTRRWLYVHYFDGSEELDDRQVDAHEWFNLGNDQKYAEVKKELAGHIPVDRRFRQFVRWGRWKAVIRSDGEVMLFDILAAHGISEQVAVAAQNPKIVERILDYLKTKNIGERYVKMPAEEEARQ